MHFECCMVLSGYYIVFGHQLQTQDGVIFWSVQFRLFEVQIRKR